MIGDAKNPGLYLLSAMDIFEYLEDNQAYKTIAVSYFEIYCGKVFDLLNNREKLVVREDAKQNVNVVGLSRHQVLDIDGLFQKINHGNSIRVTSQTGKNTDSSRSHAILQIYVVEKNKINGMMSFIDLAGNERGEDTKDHEAQTRHDGAEISKSLLALKECIRALDQDKKHVPFRGSKLTMVLKDSFVGKCKTVMIGNISPCLANCEYTLNTLRYADRVKELKKDVKDRGKNKGDDLMLARGDNRNRIDIKPETNLGIIITKFDQNDETYMDKKQHKMFQKKQEGAIQNPQKLVQPQKIFEHKHQSSQEAVSINDEDERNSLNLDEDDEVFNNYEQRPDQNLSDKNAPVKNQQGNQKQNVQKNTVPAHSTSTNNTRKKQEEEEEDERLSERNTTRRNIKQVPAKNIKKTVAEDFQSLEDQHEKALNHLVKEENSLLRKHTGHVRLMTNLNDIVCL